MSKTKSQPFPLKHKEFDFDKAIKDAAKSAAAIRELLYQEGLKHCRCCPAHPEYENLDHSAYE